MLFSERVLESPRCELDDKYHGCSIHVTEKNKDSYECPAPTCSKVIHVKCDKSLKGKPSEHQFCPTCRNLDPETWKPVIGARRPRYRRN